MRHTQNEQHDHDHSNGGCACPSCLQDRHDDDQDLQHVSHENHDHSHGHEGHDHDASVSDTASLTTGELNGGNSTSKPNFNWAQGAEQISRDDRKWDGGAMGSSGTVTYSYLSNSQASSGYGQVSSAQKAAIEKAMAQWSMIANIDFVAANGGSNISNNGELKFQGASGNGGGWASWSTRGSEMVNATVALNGSGLSLALHEVGHAIGLSHPGSYNGGGFSYNSDAEFYQDSDQYTVMSYWGGGNTGASLRPATGPALYDIAAIQRVYGANNAAYTGDTTYGFNSNTGDAGWTLSGASDWIQAAIWDAGGTDTIDMSGYTRNADIDLRQESFSSTGTQTYNLAIAKGVVIENAIGGSGNDTLRGNSSANDLDGGQGNDTMRGGTGNDFYRVDSAADTVIEAARQGVDFIFTTVSYQISSHVERLVAEASAAALNLTAKNNQNDILIGNASTNVFVDQFGRDTYVGGGGADFFRFIANLDGVNNFNRINDFNPVDDKIQLENAIFTGLATGNLSAAQFRAGSNALDANDRVIYESSTGTLYFDRDGSGAADKVAFAAVAAGTALTEDDFQII